MAGPQTCACNVPKHSPFSTLYLAHQAHYEHSLNLFIMHRNCIYDSHSNPRACFRIWTVACSWETERTHGKLYLSHTSHLAIKNPFRARLPEELVCFLNDLWVLYTDSLHYGRDVHRWKLLMVSHEGLVITRVHELSHKKRRRNA